MNNTREKILIMRNYLKGWSDKYSSLFIKRRKNIIYYKNPNGLMKLTIAEFNELFNDLAKEIYQEDLSTKYLKIFEKIGYKAK